MTPRARGTARDTGDELRLPSDYVIAYRAGSLSAGERRWVEEVAAGRPELEALLTGEPELPASTRRLVRSAPLLSAFLVVAALGLVALFAADRSGSSSSDGLELALLEGRFVDAEAQLAELGFLAGPSFSTAESPGAGGAFGPVRSERSDVRLAWLEPRGRTASPRPPLRWSSPADAGPFELRVLDESGGEVLRVEVDATELAWPDDARALAPGGWYRFLLADRAQDGRADESTIVMLGADELEALRTQRAAVELTLDSELARRFAVALLLLDRDVRAEASRELALLRRALAPEARGRLDAHLRERGFGDVADGLSRR